MSPFNPERKYNISPQEQQAHIDTERRRSTFAKGGKSGMEKLPEDIERFGEQYLSSEEHARAFKKAVEHRDNPRL